ncbi:MAG: DUF2029 domain-containing protein [Acidobacteria bacterium]|nr:DUF2029 domain-containing protein [Acidobacteriota bacterium]
METVDRKREQHDGVGGEKGEIIGVRASTGGVVVFLAAIFASMPPASSRLGVTAFLALYATALALWFTLARQSRLQKLPPAFAVTVTVAIILRAAFLPFDPTLSQDVQRYRWDGLVAKSGANPYRYPPEAPELAQLHTNWHRLINHPEIATIYPPAAQGLFALLALAGNSLFVWRLAFLAFDLATIRLLRPRDAWLWATCPLVVVEGFWSLHLEIAAVALLVASVRAVAQRNSATGGVAAGLAAGMKVVPIAALPALALFSNRRARFVAFALVTLIAPALPFLSMGPLMPGFGDYASRWEFNAPLYESVHWLVDAAHIDNAAKTLFTSLKDPLHAESIAPFVYAQLHAERMARAICLLAFLAGLFAAVRLPTLEARVAWSIAALLIVSPALHPWYWLVLLPFAFEAESFLLVALAVASPASYLLYGGGAVMTAAARSMAWLVPAITALVYRRRIGFSRPEAPVNQAPAA